MARPAPPEPKQKKRLLRHVDARFRQRRVKADPVGVIALQPSVRQLHHRVAGSHLPAQGIQFVQIFQHLHLVGLCNSEPGKGHVPQALYDVAQMFLTGDSVKIHQIEAGGLVPPVLHPGRKRLGQGITQQGDEPGMDIDCHNYHPTFLHCETALAFCIHKSYFLL
jgi:hypothetical protein